MSTLMHVVLLINLSCTAFCTGIALAIWKLRRDDKLRGPMGPPGPPGMTGEPGSFQLGDVVDITSDLQHRVDALEKKS